MRIRDLMAKGGRKAGPDTVNIIAHALSMRKEEVLTRTDALVEDRLADAIEGLFEERAKGKPLAYITGEKEFFSHSFFVDERVLIPRPETELLVEEALAILKEEPEGGPVMDMGTGSGAIGNTIAREGHVNVLCVDISPGALTVARKNGGDPAVAGRLTYLCSDLFNAIGKGAKFRMVLANLPYVAETEWDAVMTDVKDYEPASALLAGADGMDIYRRFVEALPEHLEVGGHTLSEIGGAAQAEIMKNLLESRGFRVSVKKDLAGRERVVIGTWINS